MEKNTFASREVIGSLKKSPTSVEEGNIERFELGYENAVIAYNEGRQMRDRLMEISGDDPDFCYDVLVDIYKTFFADLSAEERSRHIMHRIILGTTINKKESDIIIYDREHDQKIFELFFEPAVHAKSKEEIRMIADRVMKKAGNGYIVQ